MQKIYPFKFLDAYALEDKDIFFGREAEIQALYEMVFQADLILVYGASGTGKTSLIQCGLANKFNSYDWFPIYIRRGTDLNATLNKAIDEGGGKNAEEEYLDFLEEEKLSPIAQKFRAVYLQQFRPIYLIFDQFEELYILGSKAEQAQFIQTIQEILKIEQPVKVIFSVREEYLGELYEFEKQVPELLRKKIRIEPMNLDKVREILLGINRLKNSLVKFSANETEALAEEIFAKIKGKEKTLGIQLPYLQVFMDKWYLLATQDENRQSSIELNLANLAQMGDIGDILRDFLEEQVVQIAHQVKEKPETIWKILSPFVTLEGTKEPLNLAQLQTRLPELKPELVALTLQALTNRRILRLSENEQLYEIAHDSLAKQVASKRSDEEIALLEVQQLIKTQTGLKAEAREYFTEKQLLFMEPYLPKLKLDAEQTDWLYQSQAHLQAQKAAIREAEAKKMAEREAQRKMEQRRKKWLMWLYFFVSAFAISWSILLYWQYERAQKALNKANNSIQMYKAEQQKRIRQEIQSLKSTIQTLKSNGEIEDAKEYERKVDSLTLKLKE